MKEKTCNTCIYFELGDVGLKAPQYGMRSPWRLKCTHPERVGPYHPQSVAYTASNPRKLLGVARPSDCPGWMFK